MGGRLLTLLIAAALGVLVAYSVAGTPSASAQPSAPAMSPEEEIFRFRKWLERTKPSAFTTSEQATANQRVLTTAARSRVGGLAPHLVKGGLAGVAAGIWIHNGVTLYNGLTEGPAPLQPIHLDARFRQAEIALEGSSGAGGGFMRSYTNGALTGSGTVMSASYSFTPNNCTLSMSVVGKSSSSTAAYGVAGFRQMSGSAATSGCGISKGFFPTTAMPFNHTAPEALASPPRTYQFFTMDDGGPNGGVRRFFGPVITEQQGGAWKNPVFDWGDTSVIDAPMGGSYVATPQESTDLFGDISATTAAPEAPPATTPEMDPDYYPDEADLPQPDWEEWERQFGDEDGDGELDPKDPDDDNDEIPDTDDPEPKNPNIPVEAPGADPDGDGLPNKNDPDDDNDNIPDEDDPEPRTPTNPDTLPIDHPYADPDKDGKPNRTDGDDDGDQTPDQDDPAPYDPEIPKPDPTTDPNADPDGDGVPNRIDPFPQNPAKPARWTRTDRDGDFSPDTFDPSPDTTSEPENNPKPDSDTDGDNTPNQHDPFPTDPSLPSPSNPDIDQDNQPNTRDPDPYRPDQPTGGPTGDGDGDGRPNQDDPYPQDPNDGKPAPGTPGGSCPTPRRSRFDLPEINVEDTFPFSLILYAWESITTIGTSPEDRAPCVDLPFGVGDAQWCFSKVQTQVSLFRNLVWFLVGGIFMPIGFYMLIKGGSKTE